MSPPDQVVVLSRPCRFLVLRITDDSHRAELSDRKILHLAGLLLLAGRLMHAYGASQTPTLMGYRFYGVVLSLSLTTLLLATAVWLRRTVPLIMTWSSLFFFCRLLANALVNGLNLSPRWRLLDLWNCTTLLGSVCLQLKPTQIFPLPQPAWQEAALVLVGVNLACLGYLVLRVRGVEVAAVGEAVGTDGT